MPRRKTPSQTNLPEPRYKKPWKQAGKIKSGFWYVWLNQKRVRLGVNEDKQTAKGRDKALLALAELFATQQQAKAEAADPLLEDLIGEYLDELDRRLDAREVNPCSWDQARRYAFDFCTGSTGSFRKGQEPKPLRKVHNGYGALRISELKKHHIRDWLAAHGNKGSKKRYVMINASLSYAVEMGRIEANPIKGMSVNRYKPRDLVWSEEDLASARAYADPKFWVLIDTMAKTGARPGELAVVTKAHLRKGPGGVYFWVLGVSEWKNGRKTGKVRKIPLTADLVQYTLDSDDGLLFRSPRGAKWSRLNWRCCYRRLKEKLLKKKRPFNQSLNLYDLRATFITRAMDAGAPIDDVARACGTSREMVARVYHRETEQGDLNLAKVTELANKPKLRVASAS